MSTHEYVSAAMTDTLFTIAREAYYQADGLDRLRFDPEMRLDGYLQPLRDVRAAAVSAATVAHFLGVATEASCADPDTASAAKALRDADRRCGEAADRLGTGFDDVRLALRRAGRPRPCLDGLPRDRCARNAWAMAAVMARLSAETEKSVQAPVPPELPDVVYVAAASSHIAGCLYRVSDRMGHGITAAGGELPRELAAVPGRAAGRAAAAAEALKAACADTSRAARIMADAHARESLRKAEEQ